MATTLRRPAKPVEDLVAPEFKAVVTPSGIGDAARAPVPASEAASVVATATAHAPDPVSLDVWVLVSGLKPDQSAGFRQFARTRKMGPRTAPEWVQAYNAFLTRPV